MNNLCPQVCQLQRAIRPGPRPRERQNSHPFQRKLVVNLGMFETVLRLACDLSETCFDFFVMFAKERGRAPHTPPRLVQLVGCTKVGQCPRAWMRNVDKESSSLQLFLSGEIGHGTDRGNADALGLGGVKQVRHFPAFDPLA